MRGETRDIGATGLRTAGLGMGCARLGAFWQGRGLGEGLRAVAAALEGGITLFDTADCYARGLSERVIGRALRRRPAPAVVCTKAGLLKTPAALALAARHPESPASTDRTVSLRQARRALASLRPGGHAGTNFAGSYLAASAERSLRRLGLDAIDIFLLHSPPWSVLRRGEFQGALHALQAQGKVRSWGVSCAGLKDAHAALDLQGIGVIQVPFTLGSPGILGPLAARADSVGAGLLARAPFGGGVLLQRAAALGVASGDLTAACLQASLQCPGVAAVIVGMSSRPHVCENLAAASRALPPGLVDGLRQTAADGGEAACS